MGVGTKEEMISLMGKHIYEKLCSKVVNGENASSFCSSFSIFSLGCAVSTGERQKEEDAKEKLKNDRRLEKEETGRKIGRGRDKG